MHLPAGIKIFLSADCPNHRILKPPRTRQASARQLSLLYDSCLYNMAQLSLQQDSCPHDKTAVPTTRQLSLPQLGPQDSCVYHKTGVSSTRQLSRTGPYLRLSERSCLTLSFLAGDSWWTCRFGIYRLEGRVDVACAYFSPVAASVASWGFIMPFLLASLPTRQPSWCKNDTHAGVPCFCHFRASRVPVSLPSTPCRESEAPTDWRPQSQWKGPPLPPGGGHAAGSCL